MVKVWSGTPWIIDVLTGSHDEEKLHDLMQWCLDEFGTEAWPIHGQAGQWHSGCVTINGWTWMGFSTEEQMKKFLARWPSPNTMLCGSADLPADASKISAIQAESAAANVRQNVQIGRKYKLKEQPDPFLDYHSIIAIPLQVKDGFVEFHFLNKIKKWSMEVEVFLRIYELV